MPTSSENDRLPPLVTIGIPAYNRAPTLGKAIRSALEQSYPNLEVIVSDNASTDDTAALCERYKAEDRRFTYIRQMENQGPTANFATVFQRARGEYFMWLGDDDWIDNDYVEVCVAEIEGNPDLIVCAGQAEYYTGSHHSFSGAVISVEQNHNHARASDYVRRISDNGVFHGVIRKTALENSAIRNCMGWDWLVFTALSFQGKIRTTSNTKVHRALGGATQSYRNIAAVMGLHWWSSMFPFLTIAGNLSLDVLYRVEAYRSDGFLYRLAFAVKLSAIILWYKSARSVYRKVKRIPSLHPW